jgi:hypothetical protein
MCIPGYRRSNAPAKTVAAEIDRKMERAVVSIGSVQRTARVRWFVDAIADTFHSTRSDLEGARFTANGS